MQSQRPDQVPLPIDGPDVGGSDARELLAEYLEWYRDALLRKIDGLSDAQLRTLIERLTWSPLGMVKHLGWVERRWIRWGFAAEDVPPRPPGGDLAEFDVAADESAESVMAAYRDEVARTRQLIAGAELTSRAKVGGRFTTPDQAPSLARILFHLVQEYARHVGQLDIVRQLIDGTTGE